MHLKKYILYETNKLFISFKVKVLPFFFYISTIYIYCNLFFFTINKFNRRQKNILITIIRFVHDLDV